MWKPMFGSFCQAVDQQKKSFLIEAAKIPRSFHLWNRIACSSDLLDYLRATGNWIGLCKELKISRRLISHSRRAAHCNRSHLPSTLRTNVDVEVEEPCFRLIISHQWNYFKLDQTKSNKELELLDFYRRLELAVCRLGSVTSPFTICSHVLQNDSYNGRTVPFEAVQRWALRME